MSKLYFLLPNEDVAGGVISDMQASGLEEDAIGVVARNRGRLRSLPAADVAETSDFKPALLQGTLVGGGTGLLAGLVAAVVPGGFIAGGAAIAGMALAGSAFGAWVSGMVGVSVPNREISEFETELDKGAILMMVTVSEDEREAVKQIVLARHSKAVFGGESEGLASVI